MVGGVCSGIAAYFDIDPVWIRLIFAGALVFFGSGFLIYIILWIILPQADSSVEN
ncbi:MAG: PspC domain-containing protein [Bacteroidetes bacterium]|nr:PspC domain-containing protein [Bacteroidota bacterium]